MCLNGLQIYFMFINILVTLRVPDSGLHWPRCRGSLFYTGYKWGIPEHLDFVLFLLLGIFVLSIFDFVLC